MVDKVVGRPWTAEEDSLLIQAVAIHGQNDNWKQVALAVPGRTNKACRKVRNIRLDRLAFTNDNVSYFNSDGFTLYAPP
jgi:hypothetical protein